MLRLYDSPAGRAAPVEVARRGELRIYTLPSPAGAAGEAANPLADLRSCLVADLVRRISERRGLQVSAWQAVAESPADAVNAACGLLNIHPAEFSPTPPEPLDLSIGGDGGGRQRRLRPGPVLAGRQAPGGTGAAAVWPEDVAARGMDPLALRLVFLLRHYRRPADLTPEALAAADRTLRRWRARVAEWARSPSKPMSAPHAGQASDAFDDDLDVGAALRAMEALEDDPDVAPGSKFETFAGLDRVVGLDLARDIGR